MKLTKEQEKALKEFIKNREEDIKGDIEDLGILKPFLEIKNGR